ncbi:MAG: methylated-DNA--[protein]-cysteine S-methyltransferase [SAR324 cluster bacterium]|nr:methylated-DNA--[protein]-cysteine S-methyltransferase [SAR324 cluster bacterium]
MIFLKLLGAILFTIFTVLICGWAIFLPRSLKLKLITPIASRWADLLARSILGVKVVTSGGEHIPKSHKGYVSVSNHLSLIDPLLVLSTLKSPFLIKSSLLFTPFGWGAFISGSIHVNRSQTKGHLKIINKVIDVSTRWRAVHIFPEGTRSPDGKIAKFKRGTLKMVYKKNLPVLVSGLWGTNHILPKGSLSLKSAALAVITVRGIVKSKDFSSANDFIDEVEKQVGLAVKNSKSIFDKQGVSKKTKVKSNAKKSDYQQKIEKLATSGQSYAKKALHKTTNLSSKVKQKASTLADPKLLKNTLAYASGVKNKAKTKSAKASKEGLGLLASTNEYLGKLTDKAIDKVNELPKTSKKLEHSAKGYVAAAKRKTKKEMAELPKKAKLLYKTANKSMETVGGNIKTRSKRVQKSLSSIAVETSSQFKKIPGKTDQLYQTSTDSFKKLGKASKASLKTVEKKLAKGLSKSKSAMGSAGADNINSETEFYSSLSSIIGKIHLVSKADEMVSISFTKPAGRKFSDGKHLAIIKKVKKQLNEYFKGTRQKFEIDYKFAGSNKYWDIWQEMINIPYGETISYKELGEKVTPHMHPRVVGIAAGKNYFPVIIPCHRIIGNDGGLQGYAGGLKNKRILLNLEKNS